ncbi:flavohemoglobin expression-modulating QEGLA motif protein [Tessaracoccus oleiagri]|uniref:DUF1704 domain-containing protein n=1 Tax=Tessaracoccus oleiagri TaxID=686624 RepID=A0A1G9H7K0_9ACTN|nr:tyrosine/phenylalanine carboxypeptidase domain-containing protein [Tessaracoccus oleiagri]SDL08966.1 conserved hypothetical protein [Tessaracoccus oleiagri]
MTAADVERLSPDDLAVDQQLAGLSGSVRFLLEITPLNADEARHRFLSGEEKEPRFEYRDLSVDPDVAEAALDRIDVGAVEDTTLGHLLRAKHREMKLQLDMLRTRGTDDFRQLSVELYGGVSPGLLERAQDLLSRVEVPAVSQARLDAETFLKLAEKEIEAYREVDPDVGIRAEIRSDVSGVLCEGTALLISEHAKVFRHRAEALLQHEVGTHLVTQVNGSAQPVKTMGTGLARYDETQEGLAVLAEIAVGGLTSFRLRQLAARVVTAHSMLTGATFAEAHAELADAGVPVGTAFSTVMRVYRAGGFMKDAIYLRGLLELLEHVRDGGSLDLFYLGKFSLEDLPLIEDLHKRGLTEPPCVSPRYLADPRAFARIREAAEAEDLTTLVNDPPPTDPTN